MKGENETVFLICKTPLKSYLKCLLIVCLHFAISANVSDKRERETRMILNL